MTNCKLISFDPTPEMVEAAEEAYMPFGDMALAIRMAILAAPVVQGEPSLVVWALYDATADQKYIKMASDESLAIFDSEAAARRAKFLHPGTDYKRCEYYTAPQPAEQKPAPDVAQLVEALESAKNLIANHSGEVLPDKYAGDQIEQIDAALAELEKRNG